MKAIVSLILLWTCITVDADNEGPSDYLKEKWRRGYLLVNHYNSSRCFKTCGPNENDLYWNGTEGTPALSLSESGYMNYITKLYTRDKVKFIEYIRNATEAEFLYLDADDNGNISAEEFYTEHLCLGFKLKTVKGIFYALKPTGIGIPNSKIIDAFVRIMTEGNGPDIVYDAWKHIPLD